MYSKNKLYLISRTVTLRPFFFFSLSLLFFSLSSHYARLFSALPSRVSLQALVFYIYCFEWYHSFIMYACRVFHLSLHGIPFYIYLMCYDAVVLSAFCCSHNCNVSVLQHLFSSSIQYRTVSDLLIVLSAILWTYFYISFSLYKISFLCSFSLRFLIVKCPRLL